MARCMQYESVGYHGTESAVSTQQLIPAFDMDVETLSIIIVTHNAAAYIDRCLASVRAASRDIPTHVIVIDNRSDDDTVARIRHHHPDVHLIEPARRGGFARNVNIGLRVAGGSQILILNPDTEVARDALHESLDFMDRHPEVGALGARLADEGGKREASFRTYPTLWTALCEALFLDRLFPRSRLFARRTMRYVDARREQRVDWVTGAYLWIRRDVIDGDDQHPAAGYLDEDYFLFVEDTDWCHSIRQAGWELAYVPTARALHHKGSGTGWSAWRYALTCQGTRHYFAKHHGAAAAWAYEMILLLGLSLRSMLAAATSWIPLGDRSERARRAGDYARLALRIVTGRLDRVLAP